MLQSLHIKDFILIEKLELDFDEGFCTITGQTGAGKSILLDSILFCLGHRFSNDIIRPSADSCLVTLIFTSNERVNHYLQELDIDIDDNNLILKATQNTQGRKKFFINDQAVTAKLMQNLYRLLIELHGQHNHTMLLDTSSHLLILDEFGKTSTLILELGVVYSSWRQTQKEISEIDNKKEQIEQDIDYLKHVCSELEQAAVEKGEEHRLADIKRKLQLEEKAKEVIKSILGELQESSIERIIAKAQRSMPDSANNPLLESASSNLDCAYDKIEDAKAMLLQALRDMDIQEFSLDDIEDRLYQIRSLARKYSVDPDNLNDFLVKSSAELLKLENIILTNCTMKEQLLIDQENYFRLSSQLSQVRKEAALELEKRVMSELSALDMKKAVFVIEIDSNNTSPSAHGIDKVRFIASTNPGMSLSPIDKIASGGELSRFMLALRVALFDSAPKQTIIFDEIDVGISGSVADELGRRLRMLSKTVQIVVITHQPQVAGKADLHILVEKKQHDFHTSVTVRSITDQARHYELARMISGKEITKAGLKAASELIVLD